MVNSVNFGDSKLKEQGQADPASGYAAGAYSGGYGAEEPEDSGDLPF